MLVENESGICKRTSGSTLDGAGQRARVVRDRGTKCSNGEPRDAREESSAETKVEWTKQFTSGPSLIIPLSKLGPTHHALPKRRDKKTRESQIDSVWADQTALKEPLGFESG
jgi:hypothetical protein